MFGARNDKLAVFVAHTTSDEGSVGNRQQLYIGKDDRIIVFVDKLTNESPVCLVHTFHSNDTVAHTYGYGIESDDVAHCIKHRTVVKSLCDGEIFQFVVYKTDVIAR